MPKAIAVHDFEVAHDYPAIGPKNMLLNARRFPPEGEHPNLVLLAIEETQGIYFERTRPAGGSI
ncbi:MAG TPA: hypothetical protein VGZ22_14070 [Isosphaeraceae bacterium]|nr:hypothetical protein [Isosphaeraceae bacterium]